MYYYFNIQIGFYEKRYFQLMLVVVLQYTVKPAKINRKYKKKITLDSILFLVNTSSLTYFSPGS